MEEAAYDQVKPHSEGELHKPGTLRRSCLGYLLSSCSSDVCNWPILEVSS